MNRHLLIVLVDAWNQLDWVKQKVVDLCQRMQHYQKLRLSIKQAQKLAIYRQV